MLRSELYYSELDYYADRAWENISNLPQNGFVFIDVDTTAVVSQDNEQFLRKDFHDLHVKISTHREDLDIVAITYRSKNSGVPELSDYSFFNVVYMEDIKDILIHTSNQQLQQSTKDALASLSLSDEKQKKLVQQILSDPVYKLQFLMAVFGDQIPYAYLIDDGLDGELAAELGLGFQSDFTGE